MNVANVSSRTIDAAGVVTCLALAGGAWLLGVEPSLQAARRQQEARQRAADTLAEAEAQEAAVVRERGTLTRGEAELRRTGVELLGLGAANERLRKLSELAAAKGVALDKVTPGEPKPGSRSICVPIRLGGKSTFVESVDFLRALRAQFPDIAVQGLRFSGVPADPARGLGTASLELMLAWHAAPAKGAGEAGGARPQRATSAETP